ncbi:MAG: L-serine ammonia-lyase, iron-sulfur-dependent, subunit alpha [Clostridiales bacterium]|nr:MAG: L-serine ammonia-lyase, iron-sulfur-dependent, subunit alpha [Clostridiales bacterium]HJA30173.1 L-serine ammonia-lyase, iron-sulfur-dependent, subunit alpha [Candidatus Eisenbergiella pullicola]
MHRSLADLCRKAEEENRNFWEVVLEDDCRERQLSPEASFAQMRAMYRAMKDADASYDPTLYSRSGLTGRDGGKMQQYVDEHETICGPFLGRVIEKALKMGESNACMKRIVAAPTAGACGVVPAVMLPMQEACGYSDDEMTRALYVAAGIGGVIASRAFISGAQGGCQAEVGSAASMAAGAAVYLRGGDASAIAHSAAMAMKNLLGLVCDPVAGLVEVPCVKRNVAGAVVALSAADMALAGIRSKIPPDEVIDAMRSVGQNMPVCVRETGEGGLAATPAGERMKDYLTQG